MIDYYRMVEEFHEKYGHYINNKQFSGDMYPYFPTEVVKLRERLITEEAEEFKLASYTDYNASENTGIDLVLVADAIADLLYVVFGAAIAYGIPIEEVFMEVHRSNMTKAGKNEFGKTIKGEGYEPPDIKKILNENKL